MSEVFRQEKDFLPGEKPSAFSYQLCAERASPRATSIGFQF
jgi:hypothetical protein